MFMIKFFFWKKVNIDSLKKDKKLFIKNNKLTLKRQSGRHVFTEKINNIALSSDDDKIMQ